jgi:GT2 family glycosyltransferase
MIGTPSSSATGTLSPTMRPSNDQRLLEADRVTTEAEQTGPAPGARPDGAIAIVVLTYNRVHLLRQCVENVLLRTSPKTREIVIWNNASTDGTREYLDTLTDPRIRVVDHDQNIGQNAYALAFPLTTAPYMIEIDDDIIDAPEGWDLTMLDAFRRLPEIGFLAAALVDHDKDPAANMMYRTRPHAYKRVEVNGVPLLMGPTGGGCSMTSREIHDRVGGFRQSKREVFWLEDAAYIEDIKRLGFEAAYLRDLEVFHAGGPFFSEVTPEKARYWETYRRRIARRTAVKRILLAIPGVPAANRRLRWFQPPAASRRPRAD